MKECMFCVVHGGNNCMYQLHVSRQLGLCVVVGLVFTINQLMCFVSILISHVLTSKQARLSSFRWSTPTYQPALELQSFQWTSPNEAPGMSFSRRHERTINTISFIHVVFHNSRDNSNIPNNAMPLCCIFLCSNYSLRNRAIVLHYIHDFFSFCCVYMMMSFILWKLDTYLLSFQIHSAAI